MSSAADGTVFGVPYGTNDGGIYFNPIFTFEVDGQLYMQLLFTVAGL